MSEASWPAIPLPPWPAGPLTLRPLVPEDQPALLRYFQVSLPEFCRWLPNLTPDTDLDARVDQELARAAQGAATATSLKLVGVADGRIVGVFNLNEIVRGPFQCAFAGWSVASDLAGQGLATIGVRALLAIAFAQPPRGLGLHRVQANIIPHNHASIRVAEKAGMRREGLALRYLHIGGAWQDHAMYARLADEGPLDGP